MNEVVVEVQPRRSRFVSLLTKRLYLQDSGVEEWFEVKKELNAGEDRTQANLALVPMFVDDVDSDGKPTKKIVDRIDWSQYELLRMHLWVTAWHVHDANGNVPPLSLDAIRALDVETFNEINDALFAHMLEGQEEKKKERLMRISRKETASVSAPTSTS